MPAQDEVSQSELEAFDKQLSEAEAALPKESNTQEVANTEQAEPAATSTPEVKSTAQTAQTQDKQEETPVADTAKDTAKAAEKPLSKYEKAQARQNESWKKLEADKEALRLKEADLARKEAEIVEKAKAAQKPQYSPADFFDAADRLEARAAQLEADGDFEGAKEQALLAKSLQRSGIAAAKREKAEASQPKQSAASTAVTPELNAAQMASLEEAKKEFPELGKTGSPLNLATQEFIKGNPEILKYPKGPHLAAQFVSAQLGAARAVELAKEVEGLKATNQSLTQKVKELESLTSVEDGGVTAARSTGDIPFNEMTVEQMEASLRREAALQEA